MAGFRLLVMLDGTRRSRHIELPMSGGAFTSTRTRTQTSWASAIKNSTSPNESLRIYTQMQRQSVSFDSYSILFTLKSCSRKHDLTLIRHIHAHLFKIGFRSHVYVATSLLHAYILTSFQLARQLFDEMPQKNIVTYNTMITGYFKTGDIKNASLVFHNMPIKDLASWSAMIAGFMAIGRSQKGLSLFREMVFNEGMIPDSATFGSFLPRLSHMGSLGLLLGKSVHGFMEKSGWEMNVDIGTALVDMYAKCGLINIAFHIFDRMKEKNVLTWSALICGLAQHGHGERAQLMFETMKEQGLKPNAITFTGIFSACTHAGLVEEGLRCFYCMVEEYGFEPNIQHYGCVVDLLGKAGRLEEAYGVIQSMKLEPNIVVWGSFLAACKVHRQFKMAEKVILRVLKIMRPETDGGVYTLISNLYAMSEKWDEAQRIRDVMVNHNVKKVRGASFIRTAAT